MVADLKDKAEDAWDATKQKAHDLKEKAAEKIDEWDGEDKNPDGTDKSFLDKMKTKAETAWDATKEKAHELKEKAEDKIEEWKADDKAKPQDQPIK